MLRELDHYPKANTYYLAKVYLPRALRQDLTLGGRLADLRHRLGDESGPARPEHSKPSTCS